MRLAFALVAMVVASPAVAAEPIRCTAPGQNPVTVTFDSQHFKGRSLSCLSGSFVVDMTACAPTGAFSLSAPTGSAAIVALVNRWQDYSEHNGGVVSFDKTDNIYIFTGGFNSATDGMQDDWTFTIDRIAGIAKLTQNGKSDVNFACKKAEPKI